MTATHVSEEGDSLDGLVTVDPDTGEMRPTAAWTPDVYPRPHVDVSFRVLVTYGRSQLPEPMALIEEHISDLPLEDAFFVPGQRYIGSIRVMALTHREVRVSRSGALRALAGQLDIPPRWRLHAWLDAAVYHPLQR